MSKTRILVVDDHPLLRLGVRHSVEDREGLHVACECENLATTRAWLAAGGEAEVVILDRILPDGDGLELVPELKARGMKILLFTVDDREEKIYAAVDASVDGYLLKSTNAEQIVSAIGAVLLDVTTFTPEVVQKCAPNARGPNPLAGLSVRELEISECVAQGYSNKVIGAKLSLSGNTVRNHVANIMQKLNLKSRTQVAALVVQYLK